jgi:hypothetical protein
MNKRDRFGEAHVFAKGHGIVVFLKRYIHANALHPRLQPFVAGYIPGQDLHAPSCSVEALKIRVVADACFIPGSITG